MKKLFYVFVIFIFTVSASSGDAYRYQKFGRVVRVNRVMKEIVVSAPRIGRRVTIGSKLYVKIRGKIAPVIVTFPMMTSAKTRLLHLSSRHLSSLSPGSPVYTRVKSVKIIKKEEKFFDPRYFSGRWKEYWDPDGRSNVTYNDIFNVRVKNNRVFVSSPEGRNQKVTNIELKGGVLSFSLFTSFEVKYALKIHQKGKWLYGSATTPRKSFFIKWERISD